MYVGLSCTWVGHTVGNRIDPISQAPAPMRDYPPGHVPGFDPYRTEPQHRPPQAINEATV